MIEKILGTSSNIYEYNIPYPRKAIPLATFFGLPAVREAFEIPEVKLEDSYESQFIELVKEMVGVHRFEGCLDVSNLTIPQKHFFSGEIIYRTPDPTIDNVYEIMLTVQPQNCLICISLILEGTPRFELSLHDNIRNSTLAMDNISVLDAKTLTEQLQAGTRKGK